MRTTALRLVISSAAAIVLALATQASAQDLPTASVNRTRAAKIVATLPNTLITTVCTTPTTPITDFSMECPSGDCGCYTIPNGTITGSLLGKGTAALLLNADLGLPASPTTANNGANTCVPIFGTITTNTTSGRGKKGTGVTTVFNVIGSLCMPLTNNNSGSLSGGFGIISSTSTPAATGYGSLTGTINPKGALLINMKGPAS
jgi:hypothetical protein